MSLTDRVEGSNVMAIREVVMFEVKPGRYDDFLSQARELKSMIERVDVGLLSIRLSSNLIGGPYSGRVSLAFEYDSMPSWATSIDNEFNDSALMAWVSEATGPDAPATIVNRVLLRDIGL
jgi:hypothetical protein